MGFHFPLSFAMQTLKYCHFKMLVTCNRENINHLTTIKTYLIAANGQACIPGMLLNASNSVKSYFPDFPALLFQ